jgi:hypothetical protein
LLEGPFQKGSVEIGQCPFFRGGELFKVGPPCLAMVSNIAWSGPNAPAYPVFPITKGLSSRAITAGKTVNVGDVAKLLDRAR